MKKASTYFVIIALFAAAGCNQHSNANTEEKTEQKPKAITLKIADLATSKDLACGMTLEDGHIADTTAYQGKIYGFCSSECKAEFLKDPASHLSEK